VSTVSKEQEVVTIKCTDKEKKLLDLIRSIAFGEMRVIVQNAEPVRVENIKNSIKL
jgi:hypothetical protein